MRTKLLARLGNDVPHLASFSVVRQPLLQVDDRFAVTMSGEDLEIDESVDPGAPDVIGEGLYCHG
ncbi:hypothetical protein [Actinomycetospora chlora]|uniref:hypothetical protein n=1 Tax=Actinomycetospora chlora TaxID=663608 RepID=UPI0031ED2366